MLLKNFARGGMGDVYLAKNGSIAGLERLCVVKKLRGDLTRDREYVTRFIDEARVVVTLNHANICNVFDVGRVGSEYYLAMEYVSGRDVRSLQERCREKATPLPTAAALLVTCEVLQALDYAHRRHHPVTQEPLLLVHRDISPQNVLVSFEGEVKLIDFGLAASRLKVERTQPNVVMGKMAYMPPEQARGDPIDARADLFACGVLAYELLANERFYEGLNASDIWQIAGRGGFVPRGWNSLEPELATVLAKALHPEARRRFSTCADFRDALLGSLGVRFAGPPLRVLRDVMSHLFEPDIAREREALARFAALTPASVEAAVEQTKRQAVTLAQSSQSGPVADASLRAERAGRPPPIDEPSTDEGSSPVPAMPAVARTSLVPGHDDPTRVDQKRPERTPRAPIRPGPAGAPTTTEKAPSLPPAADPKSASASARNRMRPAASPSSLPPGSRRLPGATPTPQPPPQQETLGRPAPAAVVSGPPGPLVHSVPAAMHGAPLDSSSATPRGWVSAPGGLGGPELARVPAAPSPPLLTVPVTARASSAAAEAHVAARGTPQTTGPDSDDDGTERLMRRGGARHVASVLSMSAPTEPRGRTPSPKRLGDPDDDATERNTLGADEPTTEERPRRPQWPLVALAAAAVLAVGAAWLARVVDADETPAVAPPETLAVDAATHGEATPGEATPGEATPGEATPGEATPGAPGTPPSATPPPTSPGARAKAAGTRSPAPTATSAAAQTNPQTNPQSHALRILDAQLTWSVLSKEAPAAPCVVRLARRIQFGREPWERTAPAIAACMQEVRSARR